MQPAEHEDAVIFIPVPYTVAMQRIATRRAFSVITLRMLPFIRSFEALHDSFKIAAHHQTTTKLGRGWERPDLALSDEQLEKIAARRMGRTLADIDDLPETRP